MIMAGSLAWFLWSRAQGSSRRMVGEHSRIVNIFATKTANQDLNECEDFLAIGGCCIQILAIN